jgi:AAA domain-containing protein
MRFNFFGGPGAGKSTTAALVFAAMKKELFSVELVSEYVKAWAYAKQPVDFYDQFYIQAKQMHYEYRFLKNGVKNIVTDSPVALSYVYAPPSLRGALQHVSDTYDQDFASLNIFLVRGDKPYVAAGRYQDKEKALEIDEKIMQIVPNLVFANYGDMDGIMQYIRENAK